MFYTLTTHQFLKCFLPACSKALNTPHATAPREPPPLVQVHFLLVLILYDEDGSHITSPKVTPTRRPWSPMTVKFVLVKAIRGNTRRMMPLAASNPTTANDLCFHDTTNAAIASAIALMTEPSCR